MRNVVLALTFRSHVISAHAACQYRVTTNESTAVSGLLLVINMYRPISCK